MGASTTSSPSGPPKCLTLTTRLRGSFTGCRVHWRSEVHQPEPQTFDAACRNTTEPHYKEPEYSYNVIPAVFSDSVRAKSAAMHRYLRDAVFDKKRPSLQAWQDRLRDPSLTALLVLQIFLLFV